MDNKLNIAKKVIKVIKKNGIKKYKKNILNKKKSKEEKPILIKKPTRKINNANNDANNDSNNDANNDDKNIIRYKNSKTWRKLPDFELKNNIGIIKFYSFIRMQGKDSDLINDKDRDKIIEAVTNRLDDWLNNKKIKGLIIDFSKHNATGLKSPP